MKQREKFISFSNLNCGEELSKTSLAGFISSLKSFVDELTSLFATDLHSDAGAFVHFDVGFLRFLQLPHLRFYRLDQTLQLNRHRHCWRRNGGDRKILNDSPNQSLLFMDFSGSLF